MRRRENHLAVQQEHDEYNHGLASKGVGPFVDGPGEVAEEGRALIRGLPHL